MKKLVIGVILLVSTVSMAAQPLKNPEFAAQAIQASTAINKLNWGDEPGTQLEVISEKYSQDDVNQMGDYLVRLFNLNPNGKKSDAGKDFKVRVLDGAVLSVKVVCRICS